MKRKFMRVRPCFFDGKTVAAGVFVVLFAGILSRLLSGSPVPLLRIFGLYGRIPRSWFFCVAWLFWYALIGLCLGCLLGERGRCCEVHRYKACLFLVVMLIFNVIWYPLFFRAAAFFLALIDIAVMLLFAFLAWLELLRVKRMYSTCIFIHIIWLIFCFVLNLCVLFWI